MLELQVQWFGEDESQETDNIGYPSNHSVGKTTNKKQVHDRTVTNDPQENIFPSYKIALLDRRTCGRRGYILTE